VACKHIRALEFCPEGKKLPEPICEVWCHDCGHHWILVGIPDEFPCQPARLQAMRTEAKQRRKFKKQRVNLHGATKL